MADKSFDVVIIGGGAKALSLKNWEHFSPRDAETFLKVWKGWREIMRPAFVKAMHAVAPPPHEPDEMEKWRPGL